MLSDLGHPYADGEEVYDITFENVQAGLRTDYLFRLANHRGGLVLGTGDLSELALGWCTYGVGDQMSHYNVNGGVPKTLIQHLIRWAIETDQYDADDRRGAAGDPRPGDHPRADPGQRRRPAPQRTEDSTGPYALQDFTLYHVLRRGYRPSKIAFLAWHAWHDVEAGSGRPGSPRTGAASSTSPRSARGSRSSHALLRQPVQALGAAQRPQGHPRRHHVARAATGGCRPTPRPAAWLAELRERPEGLTSGP